MAKYEMTKSLEARKLNKRTGLLTNDPPLTIPYGAILEDVEEVDDNIRFLYLLEMYQVRRDIARGAIRPLDQDASEIAGTGSATAAAAPAPERPRLIFQMLNVRGTTNSLARARIPGGWLVAGQSGGVAFVPDPGHQWDGASLD
jgi:hypothetical protein